MKVRSNSSYGSYQLRRAGRSGWVALLSLGLLAGCSAAPVAQQPAEVAEDSSATSQTEAIAQSEFQFPMVSCGDEATEPSPIWYTVFLDGADINEVRTKYCQDAVSTLRPGTGVPSVQIASFTSYTRAAQFAALVGGQVEQPTTAAAPSTTTPQASWASPSPQVSPSLTTPSTATTTPSPERSERSERSGQLTASDPDSEINVRDRAGIDSSVVHVAYVGDRFQIISEEPGGDGYTWYNVRFESGETGWVRGDFIEQSASVASITPSSTTPRSTTPRAITPSATTPTTSPPRSEGGGYGTLTAEDTSIPINVRDRAGMDSSVQDVGYAGDRVRILSEAQGDDGYTWYNVRFESGVVGWVRGDLVTRAN